MENQALKELGLTDNEIKIYIFLLKQKESTTGPIIKETNIANSRVYESLNSLISKCLVTYSIQRDGKHFSSANPNILLEKQKELEKKMKELVPQLTEIKGKEQNETTVAVYEGFEGFKTAFKRIIDDCPKGETIFIMGFPEPTTKVESLRTFLSNMNLKSEQKKHKLKIILEKSSRQTLGKDREKEKITQVRYMPDSYINPAGMDIFLDYVYIFLWEEKPYVFMIKNKKIAESFKTYHQVLWNLAKP